MDYTKLTDFATKDALLSGNPSKLLRGTELDAEFGAIVTAVATKTDDSAAAITGGTINGTVIGAVTPAAATVSSLTDSGNLTFTGTANRITGDFSNATVANRVMFQTSTVNGNTTLGAIPNGTAATCTVAAYSDIDLTNANFAAMQSIEGAAVVLEAGRTGGAPYTPMTFYTGGSERMRIDTSGNVTLSSATGGLGYGTGAGGTVTQATSRTTAVTLNKPTGQITMFTAAGSASWQAFTVNNSLVTVNDTVVASVRVGATNIYSVIVGGVNAGSFVIYFNAVSGTASDTPVINFAIIKGSAS